MKIEMDKLTPKEIVAELDKYIIGQNKAKRSVAIALRNRYRRTRLPEELRDEVAPKNIIMIGPTGVGKTEIAKRLARLTGAPFIKVEATKYTEVGYVGRDVESMVRDLMSVGISLVRQEFFETVQQEAEKRAEEALLDLLLPGIKKPVRSVRPGDTEPIVQEIATTEDTGSTRERFREKLRKGELDEKMVEINITKNSMPQIEIFSGGMNLEDLDINLGNSLGNIFGGKKKKKNVTVKQAKEVLFNDERNKLIDMDRVAEIAKERVEEMGIIFIDEIDKIASSNNRMGADVSREGVQRDILPIVEGSKVNTRHGMIDTAHILFIAAGAFHMSKPSDLIPELQGRFPLRVELQALTSKDFQQILTQPKNALIRQYIELLKTEEVTLDFKDEAITRLSEIATDVNTKTENIGARRLHTIMESLLEDVSFHAPDMKGQTIEITRQYVDDRLNAIIEDRDVTRFIL
ncbi:MAG: ATP-dependent protease ATPase subunit HslU [Spirochaetales bacterium]|nr:ATP-dependent protease ATPase subunit HslU [Spirochaetales bacterium]